MLSSWRIMMRELHSILASIEVLLLLCFLFVAIFIILLSRNCASLIGHCLLILIIFYSHPVTMHNSTSKSQNSRVILEPAGALAVAGLKKYIEENNISGKTFVAITSGANMDFNRYVI